jgi:aspartate 1-decarboxylase
VLSSREVIVDHANWGRDGRIYLNAPVVDVSENNDWSLVRVWNTRAGTMGSSTYNIKGFISQRNVSLN